jgi:prevent-host-death family protein
MIQFDYKGGGDMESIRPSADLRNRYGEISRECKENKQPIYITVNGRGDTVLMGIAQYEQMKAELELLRLLAESEDDVRNGRVAPIEDTFSSIRRTLLAEMSQ